LITWLFYLTVSWTVLGSGGANTLGFTPAQMALLQRTPSSRVTETTLVGRASHNACLSLRDDIRHYGPIAVGLSGGRDVTLSMTPCRELMVGDPTVEQIEESLVALDEWCEDGRP